MYIMCGDYVLTNSVICIAPQKPQPVLVLCKEELLVLGNQCYNIPFALDLHKPAVISMEYLKECPDNIIRSLNSICSKQSRKDKEVATY